MKSEDKQKTEMTEIRLNLILLEGYLSDLEQQEETLDKVSFMETLKKVIQRKKEKLQEIRKDRARKASLRYSSRNREKAKLRSKLWYEKHKKKNNIS